MDNRRCYDDISPLIVQPSLFELGGDVEELCPYLVRNTSFDVSGLESATSSQRRDILKRHSGPNYAYFLAQHRTRGVPEDIGKGPDVKRVILTIFSARFRQGGSNDLTKDYSPAQVGKMYMGILKQALKQESGHISKLR